MVSSTFWMPAPELSVAVPQKPAPAQPAAHDAVPYRPDAAGNVAAAVGAAATAMLGDEPRSVSTPPAVALDCAATSARRRTTGRSHPGRPRCRRT